MSDYRPTPINSMPNAVKNILILNIILFLGTQAYLRMKGLDLSWFLGEHYFLNPNFKVWQPITCMFMHANVAHIFLNMFALYMFGTILERYWGGKKFLVFYLVCGLGGGIVDETWQYFKIESSFSSVNDFIREPNDKKLNGLLASKEVIIYSNVGDMQTEFNSMADRYNDLQSKGKINEANAVAVEYFKNIYKPLIHQAHDQVSIGASGAIMGLLMAFALIFPNVPLMFMFIPYPIKAKFAVIIYGLVELSLGFAQIEGDPIGHFAHLGGLVFGFILMMYWKRRDKRIFH